MKTPTTYEVYLADDDADDRMLFEEALAEVRADALLRTASDGEKLMGLLQTTTPPPPSVIFLDLNMPVKNGFECIREIKESEKYKGIPLVVYSTTNQQDAIDKTFSNGADYYLCKPNSYQKLKSVLKKYLTVESPFSGVRSREQFLLSY